MHRIHGGRPVWSVVEPDAARYVVTAVSRVAAGPRGRSAGRRLWRLMESRCPRLRVSPTAVPDACGTGCRRGGAGERHRRPPRCALAARPKRRSRIGREARGNGAGTRRRGMEARRSRIGLIRSRRFRRTVVWWMSPIRRWKRSGRAGADRGRALEHGRGHGDCPAHHRSADRRAHEIGVDDEPGRTGLGPRPAEFVNPRGPWTYSAPVVVVVDGFSVSMAEGCAIALSGLGHAGIVGARWPGSAPQSAG